MSAAFLTECFVHDAMRPITSLDQLWTQAMLLRGFIMPKVDKQIPSVVDFKPSYEERKTFFCGVFTIVNARWSVHHMCGA